MAAKGFVFVLFSQHYKFVSAGDTVGVTGWLSALDADCMNFCNMLCNSHQSRHWTKRLTKIIHIQTGAYYTHSPIGQLIADINYSVIKKLNFINANYIYICREQ